MSYIGAIISTTGYILLFSLFLTGCTLSGCATYNDIEVIKERLDILELEQHDGHHSLTERVEKLEKEQQDGH